LAMASFFIATTGLWLWLDRSPSQWDDSWYLTNSLVMYDALREGGITGYGKTFLTILGTKPPLITALPTPFYLTLGRNAHVAYAVNLIFMAVFFGAIYQIGRQYWGKRVGVLAVYFTGTMPLLYGLSRWYLTDYPLAALVCLAVYLLIASHDFGN